ncbi:hypothetical protein HanIR_Chr09g0435031 [Helianthus annuus]|nr:hypothetical protein HanIR_Chr09g0435031 [Helianthus annuus]
MSNSVEVGCPFGGGNGELGVKVKDRVYGCRRQDWCAVMVLKTGERYIWWRELGSRALHKVIQSWCI